MIDNDNSGEYSTLEELLTLTGEKRGQKLNGGSTTDSSSYTEVDVDEKVDKPAATKTFASLRFKKNIIFFFIFRIRRGRKRERALGVAVKEMKKKAK